MKPTYQTTPTDCLRACVASLLHLPAEEVPDFCAEVEGDEWWEKMQGWFAERKMFLLMILLNDKTPWFSVPNPLAIFIGFDAKAMINHAIIGRVNGGEFVAIFNPSGAGEVDWPLDAVCFLVPLDPNEAPRVYREAPAILKSSVLPRNAIRFPNRR